MRTLTAILCLTAFFALQYGKLVSYWHCRISNLTAATPCDCVKQLLDDHKKDAPHTAATLKEKTEDVVLFHELPQQWQSPVTQVTYAMAYVATIPETCNGTIFQPPRL